MSYDKIEVRKKLEEVQQQWKELKQKGVAFRKKELLDFYNNEIGNETIHKKAL